MVGLPALPTGHASVDFQGGALEQTGTIEEENGAGRDNGLARDIPWTLACFQVVRNGEQEESIQHYSRQGGVHVKLLSSSQTPRFTRVLLSRSKSLTLRELGRSPVVFLGGKVVVKPTLATLYKLFGRWYCLACCSYLRHSLSRGFGLSGRV